MFNTTPKASNYLWSKASSATFGVWGCKGFKLRMSTVGTWTWIHILKIGSQFSFFFHLYSIIILLHHSHTGIFLLWMWSLCDQSCQWQLFDTEKELRLWQLLHCDLKRTNEELGYAAESYKQKIKLHCSLKNSVNLLKINTGNPIKDPTIPPLTSIQSRTSLSVS